METATIGDSIPQVEKKTAAMNGTTINNEKRIHSENLKCTYKILSF